MLKEIDPRPIVVLLCRLLQIVLKLESYCATIDFYKVYKNVR